MGLRQLSQHFLCGLKSLRLDGGVQTVLIGLGGHQLRPAIGQLAQYRIEPAAEHTSQASVAQRLMQHGFGHRLMVAHLAGHQVHLATHEKCGRRARGTARELGLVGAARGCWRFGHVGQHHELRRVAPGLGDLVRRGPNIGQAQRVAGAYAVAAVEDAFGGRYSVICEPCKSSQ